MASTTEQLDRAGRLALGQINNIRTAQFFGQKFSIPAFTETAVWDGPVDYTFTDYTTDRISKISSSNVGDIGQIEITGLDDNWDEVVQIATLNGQNKVNLTTELIRINNIVSLKNLIGNVYIYEDGTITGGIPDDLTTVKGFVSSVNNLSKTSVYSVPRGYLVTFRQAVFGTIPVTSGCCFRFKNYVKIFGGASLLVFDSPLVSNGTTFVTFSTPTTVSFPEKSDLYGRVYTSLPNAACSMVFDGELIKV